MPGRILRGFKGKKRMESYIITADKTILKLETSELHQAWSLGSGPISIQKSRGLSGLIRNSQILWVCKTELYILQEISVSGWKLFTDSIFYCILAF